ncbi:hypothetical protein F4703DRAFT_1796786 [Phycomyces blakesleeanus]
MQNTFSTKRNKFLSINSTANRELVCTVCSKPKIYETLNAFRRHFNKCQSKETDSVNLGEPSSSAAITPETDNMSMQMEFILESPQNFYSKCTSDNSEDDIPNNGESADFNVESDVLNLDAEMEAVFIGANPIAATMNVYLDGDSSTQTFYHQENNTECFSEYISPFKSKAAFILHVLFHSNEDLSSERSIKKIMFAIEKLDFTKPDAKNEIPVFPTTTCTAVNRKGQCHEFSINKPSEYIRHILACPGKTAQMSSLSDFTENQWLNLNQGTKFKIRLPRDRLMKVVICSLNLYSDDTSGNFSKQYNKYNSYLIYFAVISLEMLSLIVDDFVELEKGIVMYSKDHDEDVLVVAPLLLFMGDNPWQSQLAMHSKTLRKHFCRKCHLEAPQSTQKDNTAEISYLPGNHNGAEKITKEFLYAFVTVNTDSELYKHRCDLNYSKNGSKEFLRLEAFDAIKNMPVEILHTIPLGLSQYLVTYLFKFSRMSTAEMARLEPALSSYRVCKSYSRRFRN